MTTSDADTRNQRLARVREGRLVRVRQVFAGNPEHGTPEKPTKDGFIALAKAGRKVWNAWRDEWPEPTVDFIGHDFRVDLRKESAIDFSRFIFGTMARFHNAQFGFQARFDGAQFGPCAEFYCARFDGQASFAGALFGSGASFSCAQFEDGATFSGAEFLDRACFTDVQFGAKVNFSGAAFGDDAWFHGSQFDKGARFDGVEFEGKTTFAAASQRQVERFWREMCRDEAAVEERIRRAEERELRSDAFKHISFRGAGFYGDVSFQNRAFLEKTQFGSLTEPLTVPSPDGGSRTIEPRPTVFMGIPAFHGCTLHQDTSFEGAEFLAEPCEDAARAYRTLKLAMSKEQATREEQMFFRLEMETERELTHGARWWLFTLYKISSDYGFGLKEPIARVWLLVGAICAGLFHLPMTVWHVVASGEPITTIGQRLKPWVEYSLINFAPLPGLDRVQEPLRKLLFGDGGFQLAAIFIEILHKTSALLALFLVALALRNLFKMKG